MIYFTLFYEFFKIGLFSIGGGLATLPFLYSLADKYPWFDRAMLADMIAVSESTPGPMGINMATYAGFHAKGILGGIIATSGLVLPSIIIIIIVSKFLNRFNDNKYVEAAFYTLRPCITALIAIACFEIYKISIFNIEKFNINKNFIDIFNFKNMFIFIIIFILIKKLKKHPILYIGLGALSGIILSL